MLAQVGRLDVRDDGGPTDARSVNGCVQTRAQPQTTGGVRFTDNSVVDVHRGRVTIGTVSTAAAAGRLDKVIPTATAIGGVKELPREQLDDKSLSIGASPTTRSVYGASIGNAVRELTPDDHCTDGLKARAVSTTEPGEVTCQRANASSKVNAGSNEEKDSENVTHKTTDDVLDSSEQLSETQLPKHAMTRSEPARRNVTMLDRESRVRKAIRSGHGVTYQVSTRTKRAAKTEADTGAKTPHHRPQQPNAKTTADNGAKPAACAAQRSDGTTAAAANKRRSWSTTTELGRQPSTGSATTDAPRKASAAGKKLNTSFESGGAQLGVRTATEAERERQRRGLGTRSTSANKTRAAGKKPDEANTRPHKVTPKTGSKV